MADAADEAADAPVEPKMNGGGSKGPTRAASGQQASRGRNKGRRSKG